jgi:hypothetical protein
MPGSSPLACTRARGGAQSPSQAILAHNSSAAIVNSSWTAAIIPSAISAAGQCLVVGRTEYPPPGIDVSEPWLPKSPGVPGSALPALHEQDIVEFGRAIVTQDCEQTHLPASDRGIMSGEAKKMAALLTQDGRLPHGAWPANVSSCYGKTHRPGSDTLIMITARIIAHRKQPKNHASLT